MAAVCSWVSDYGCKDHTALVSIAKLAEQAERFEDMAVAMKTIAEMGNELNNEERNLLSVAYKNVVGARRSSWRIMSSIAKKQSGTPLADQTDIYLKKVEEELTKICNDVLVNIYWGLSFNFLSLFFRKTWLRIKSTRKPRFSILKWWVIIIAT